jgi:WD40 repeat protein
MSFFLTLMEILCFSQLLDILTGHQAPISSITFHPLSNILASGSWDRTLRLWDVFGRNPKTEGLEHTHDVLCVAYRPDGREICVSTLGGELVVCVDYDYDYDYYSNSNFIAFTFTHTLSLRLNLFIRLI